MTEEPEFTVLASNQLAAYMALRDAKLTVGELQNAHGEEWRRRWVSTLTFLRSVGHVLDKIDSAASETHSRVIGAWWANLNSSRPEPKIFWGFIEPARNTALKEYSSGVHVEIHSPAKSYPGVDMTVRGSAFGLYPEEGVNAVYTYSEPPYEGRNPIELAEEAVDWWYAQLSEISNAVE